ncbi:M14 family metallopeptidase [Anaerosporobacter sp.]|uniref:M14 family metallopeptidase n=1 Tax=Anaerosporobacter sp. TaxID=1872529 RepID=UPI00286FA95B|nr:M14 family zinc carboxypeptidase [Anaerosporobacter sp.]
MRRFREITRLICTYGLMVGLSTSITSYAMEAKTTGEVFASEMSIVNNSESEGINQEDNTQQNSNPDSTNQDNTNQEDNNTENSDTENDRSKEGDTSTDNPEDSTQENDTTQEETKPTYKKINDSIYVKKACSVYEKPDTKSKKLGTAILYRKYTRVGIGEDGYNQIMFDGAVAYVKESNVTTKKPTIPTNVVDITDTKYNYDDMKKDIQLLNTYYPDYVTVQSLGKSEDNREIYCIILGNVNAKNNILIQGSMHAREYINTQLLMAQLEYYLTQYEKGSYKSVSYQKMFDEVAVHVIPMANPDGVTLCQYGTNKIADKKLIFALKTMQKSSNYSRWKANVKGVDLNKNFPFLWKKNVTEKKVGSMNYPGVKAQSESETQALVKYTKSIKGLKVALSYHSMGNIIYWDYGQKGKLREQCKELVNLVKSITGYTLVTQSSSTISYGGYSDYVVGELGVPAITIETGMVIAPVSHSQFNTIWKQNKTVIPEVILQVIKNK